MSAVGVLDVSDRICVSPPYFALEDLTSAGPGRVSAVVPVQCSAGRQVSPIGLAEAGRHAAILGLCAAATVNEAPGRHYYLARSVTGWSTVSDSGCDEDASVLRGRASAVFVTTRRARARTSLLHMDGAPLLDMGVEYDVLSERVFRRLFGAPLPESSARSVGNPYRRPPRVDDLKVTAAGAAASLTVAPAQCRGHFAGHPTLPVAVTGGAMVGLLDQIVGHSDSSARWIFHSFQLRADRLPRAGERVELAARVQNEPVGRSVHCEATTESKTATTLTVRYALA